MPIRFVMFVFSSGVSRWIVYKNNTSSAELLISNMFQCCTDFFFDLIHVLIDFFSSSKFILPIKDLGALARLDFVLQGKAY